MARAGSERIAGAARAGGSAAALAMIVIGPGHLRCIVGSRPALDGWAMYHDLGVGLVDARFVQITAAGAELPVDPPALLRSEPRPVSRRLRSPAEFDTLVRRLCAALGPSAQLRAHARVATQDGWVTTETGVRDLCTARATRPPGAR